MTVGPPHRNWALRLLPLPREVHSWWLGGAPGSPLLLFLAPQYAKCSAKTVKSPLHGLDSLQSQRQLEHWCTESTRIANTLCPLPAVNATFPTLNDATPFLLFVLNHVTLL